MDCKTWGGQGDRKHKLFMVNTCWCMTHACSFDNQSQGKEKEKTGLKSNLHEYFNCKWQRANQANIEKMNSLASSAQILMGSEHRTQMISADQIQFTILSTEQLLCFACLGVACFDAWNDSKMVAVFSSFAYAHYQNRQEGERFSFPEAPANILLCFIGSQ